MEERRSLYNSLRLNWLSDPSMQVQPWQVEDYRSLPIETIFERLKEQNLFLDRVSFLALADNCDTPEQLSDDLLADTSLDAFSQDRIYLLIFELWRRLLPEKPCLSTFCDELDYQINLYDQHHPDSAESIQDVLANLAVILDENTDEGADPITVFEGISAVCANDINSFLYDFIAEQIDHQNESYANELLDDFSEYMKDHKWFDFLKARVISSRDPLESNQLLKSLVKESKKEPDLEFNLELLSFMVQGGDRELFVQLFKQTLPLLEYEEDLQDLMMICADYYRCLDHETQEQAIQKLLDLRLKNAPEASIEHNDPHLKELLKIVN